MSAAFTAITVHESELPQTRRQALHAALAAGDIAGKWLYDSPAQAQCWLEYHQAYSPSRTDTALQQLYDQAFQRALAALDASLPWHAVSLGCGGGRKDRALLEQAGRMGRDAAQLRYTPLDSSPALVLEAVGAVAAGHPRVPQHPLVADLGATPPLGQWLGEQEGHATARLYTCFGMLPNFEPAPFLAYLHGLLRPADRLLLSANLSPRGFPTDQPSILPQYDNPPARRWYWCLLDHLGVPPGHLVLSVEARALEPTGNAWRIEALGRVRHAFELPVQGHTHQFAENAALRVFFSNRFTRGGIEPLLTAADLVIEDEWLHPSGEEGIFLLRTGA